MFNVSGAKQVLSKNFIAYTYYFTCHLDGPCVYDKFLYFRFCVVPVINKVLSNILGYLQ
jgi:hypothetical protein